MNDPARHLGLLCIDLQDIFLSSIPNQEQVLMRTQFAIEAANMLGVSIALTEQMPEKLGATTETVTRILPDHTPVFEKSGFSAFEAEGLERWIETKQIDHLLIAGIETSVCVYQTAVHGLSEDIGVTVLADCVSQRRIEDREPVLQQLLSMEAHVLPSETIFYSLLGGADHPAFRDFTKLVKAHANPGSSGS